MKKMTFFTLILLVLSTISLQTAFAQDTLEGHTGDVNSVSFSPDGTTLASGSSDGKVKLWDVATGTNIATLHGHWTPVTSVSFSPDGTTLASAADYDVFFGDGEVKLWDVATRENIATLEGYATSVSFSSDGTTLASGSDDVKLWDVATRENIATLEGYATSVSFSPDGTLLASGSSGGKVKLWDVATRENIATLEGHTSYVRFVSFSPDGTTLASCGRGLRFDEVKLWDVATRENIATLSEDWDDIRSVAFSPDSKLIASGGDKLFGKGAVKLWDVTTQEYIIAFEVNDITSVAFSPDGTLLASGSTKGKVKLWNIAELTSTLGIVSGNNQEGIIDTVLANPLVVEVRDLDNNPFPGVEVTFTVISGHGQLSGKSTVDVTTDANGRAAQTLTLGTKPGINSVEVSIGNELVTFNAVGISPYKLEITSGNFQQGKFNTALEEPLVVEVRDRDNNPVPSVEVTFTVTYGEGLLSGQFKVEHVTTDANGRAERRFTLGPDLVRNIIEVTIAEYEPVTFYAVGNSPSYITALEGHGDGVRAVSFSPDGALLASGGGEGFQEAGTVKLWDVETHTNIATLYGHTGPVLSVTFSPDGSTLASGSGDGTAKLWDVATKQNIATFKHAVGEVASVAFSPDGTLLASASLYFSFFNANLDDGTVELWDVATKQNIATLQVIATSVAFSPDGTLLASGTLDGTVELWDVATKQNIATLQGHTYWVWSVAFSPDGKTLASGALGEAATTKLWNVATRENIATLQAPGVSVAFSLDGTLLASASDVVELWDAVTGVNIATLQGHTDLVYSVAFSPDGKTLASGSEDDTSILWDMSPDTTRVPADTDTVVSISPSSVASPAVGEQLTLSLNIDGGENVASYQATVQFDGTALRYVSSAIGDFLPAGAFPLPAEASGNTVTLAAVSLTGESAGDGTLSTITFEVIAVKESTLTLSGVLLSDSAETASRPQVEAGLIVEPPQLKEDVNADGVVNILDLVRVASSFGGSGENGADVNGDGVVNILDLVLVAGAFGNAAAPSANLRALAMLTAKDVGQWLAQAGELELTDATSQRGVLFLEQLLAALAPKETALLPNYPNPFNPETWMPYQLAEDALVTLTIYDGRGRAVRTLEIGHRISGFYEDRSQAIYWDGRNDFGEGVASGVYFYHLSAGDYSAARKMLIIK